MRKLRHRVSAAIYWLDHSKTSKVLGIFVLFAAAIVVIAVLAKMVL